jgi:hypothetical protein
MRRILIGGGIALALLTGCAGTPSSTSPGAVLYAASATLSQAEAAATIYAHSPVADVAVVARIKALDNTAYAAINPVIDAAASGQSPITQAEADAGQAALKALTDYLDSQGVK